MLGIAGERMNSLATFFYVFLHINAQVLTVSSARTLDAV